MDSKFAYLIKVEPDQNNNRYYRMEQKDDIFTIEMGRVGATPMKMSRSMSLWDTTYDRKIQEGYIDRSVCCDVSVTSEDKYAPIPNEAVNRLIDDLMRYANMALKKNYTVSWKEVTQTMIEMAEQTIDSMTKKDVLCDIDVFNKKLLKLFRIIPRKMKDVSQMLAKDLLDAPKIIEREQELLDVMKAKISQEKTLANGEDRATILDALGLSIRECSKKEEEQIKKHLSSESSHLFKRAFRVNNHKTDERFYDYLKRNGMSEKNIHYYYHGSKNQNYYGIMTEGLLLNPNAPITGKMFGYGIYFAPRARKSINYTDIRGSYWAGGTSKQAYLMVYKVAYKNQKDVYVHHTDMPFYTKSKIAPYDCVFAHAGQSLLNDEVIVYREEQCTIQYVLELEA